MAAIFKFIKLYITTVPTIKWIVIFGYCQLLFGLPALFLLNLRAAGFASGLCLFISAFSLLVSGGILLRQFASTAFAQLVPSYKVRLFAANIIMVLLVSLTLVLALLLRNLGNPGFDHRLDGYLAIFLHVSLLSSIVWQITYWAGKSMLNTQITCSICISSAAILLLSNQLEHKLDIKPWLALHITPTVSTAILICCWLYFGYWFFKLCRITPPLNLATMGHNTNSDNQYQRGKNPLHTLLFPAMVRNYFLLLAGIFALMALLLGQHLKPLILIQLGILIMTSAYEIGSSAAGQARLLWLRSNVRQQSFKICETASLRLTATITLGLLSIFSLFSVLGWIGNISLLQGIIMAIALPLIAANFLYLGLRTDRAHHKITLLTSLIDIAFATLVITYINKGNFNAIITTCLFVGLYLAAYRSRVQAKKYWGRIDWMVHRPTYKAVRFQ